MDAERREVLERDQMTGQEIARFLDSTTVKAVFDGLELSYYGAWKESKDPADRERIFAVVSAFEDIRGTLKGLVERGALATQELEQGNAEH